MTSSACGFQIGGRPPGLGQQTLPKTWEGRGAAGKGEGEVSPPGTPAGRGLWDQSIWREAGLG